MSLMNIADPWVEVVVSFAAIEVQTLSQTFNLSIEIRLEDYAYNSSTNKGRT